VELAQVNAHQKQFLKATASMLSIQMPVLTAAHVLTHVQQVLSHQENNDNLATNKTPLAHQPVAFFLSFLRLSAINRAFLRL
jgi:hypothetical protein